MTFMTCNKVKFKWKTSCSSLQGIMWPQVITGAIGNVFNVVINYVFLYPLELGVA